MSTLHQRIRRSLVAATSEQGVKLLTQLVSVPVFIAHWGVGLYGEWIMVASVLVYLGMSDLGIGAVAGRHMAYHMARQDIDGASLIYNAATWLLISIGVGIGVIGAAALALVDPFSYLGLERISRGEGAAVVGLLFASVALTAQSRLALAAYGCHRRYARGQAIMTALFAIESLSMLGLVAAGGGPVAVAAIFVVGRALTLLGMSRDLRRLHPMPPTLGGGIAEARRMVLSGLAMQALPLSRALSNQCLPVIIGTALGPASAVAFATMRTLSRVMNVPMAVLMNSIEPEMRLALAGDDLALARRLYRRAGQAGFWLIAAVVVAMTAAGPYVMDVWTMRKVDFTRVELYLSLGAAAFSALLGIAAIPLMTSGAHARLGLYLLGGTLASIAGAAVTVPAHGLIGAIVATLVLEGGMLAYALVRSLRLMQDSLAGFARAAVQPAGAAFLKRILWSRE